MSSARRIEPSHDRAATAGLRRPSHRRGALAALVLPLLLTACFTGERPSFDPDTPETVSTGNAPIDLVLERLESVDRAAFTASYAIETKFGSLSSTGSVVQTSDDQRAVTIETASATTRFVEQADGDDVTCNLLTSTCEPSLNDARISDVGLPHTFYGPSFATRLRVSADRRIDVSASYTKEVAGLDARCVDIAVAGGTETFCALDTGVLAEFVGADVTIRLTSYSSEPDTSQLVTA